MALRVAITFLAALPLDKSGELASILFKITISTSYKFFYHTNDKVDITIIPFPLNITDDDVKVFAEDNDMALRAFYRESNILRNLQKTKIINN